MKRNFLHSLAFILAMVIAIPVANAAYPSFNFSIPLDWETNYNKSDINNTAITEHPGYYRQAAATDGKIFAVPGGGADVTYPKIDGIYVTYGHIIGKSDQTYWSGGSGKSNYPYESSGAYYYLGPAIASDEEGTLWCSSVRSSQGPTESPKPWAIGAKAFTYYTIRPGGDKEASKSGIALGDYATSGRADLMSVSGKGVNGRAFFWFAIANTNKIECIVMEKTKIIRKNTYTAPVTFPSGYVSGYVKEFADYTRLLLNVGSSGDSKTELYLGSIHGGADGLYNGTATITWDNPGATGLKVARYGSTAFLLEGHGIIAYSTSPTEIRLYDWTAKREIGTLKPFGDNVSKSSYVSHSMDVKINGLTADLYIYSPGVGGAKYTIKFSHITDPVSNIKPTYINDSSREITISWDNPEGAFIEKYKIRYSSDGGTTWSEAIETNHVEHQKGDPYYTFKGLPQGTYLFEVTPYYNYDYDEPSGKYHNDAWGESAVSGEIVVDPVGGVTNLDVLTSSDNPFSATVNWNLPTDGTPSKYAVSYSTDGGSTWSTKVETNDLTKTFSNLAPGSYKFKVRPFYTVSWGDETVSGNQIVYSVSAPVTNATAAYNNNQGNSIVVSWNKPDAPVDPDKYMISYSDDNGSSWSTNIETTDLSYIFEDLAIGSYKFKITPYYNEVYPGDETITESIDVSEATGITFTTTKLWESSNEIATIASSDSREIAISNNKLYVIATIHDSKIYYVGSDKNWKSFESGYDKQQFGYPMDNDDAGNIIVKSGNTYYSAATQFTIYPAGATSNAGKKEITLSGDYLPEARADFIGAQGNLLSSEGGYIWILPQDKQKLMRIKITNGNLDGVVSWQFSEEFYTNFLKGVSQAVIRPLPDGRVYIQPRSNGYRIITLPEAGGTITQIEALTNEGTSTPSGNLSSEIFALKGCLFHVKNDGAASQSIGIEIKNLTEEGNGDATLTPFEGGTSGIGGYGSLVRAVNVDEDNVDVYCYSPGHGVTVYRVSAKATYFKSDKLSSLTHKYIESTDADGNKVQDIELTWEAPKDATPTKYKIYRDGSLLATVDASTLTYTNKGVNQNYTYTVVPIFTGVNENAEHGLSVTTTEVETILYAPIISEVRNYNGYSIVEIFYKMPKASNVKPQYYNIYRNDEQIATGLTQYNYIDNNIPKTADNHEYIYKIEAVYSDTYDNATRTSDEKNIIVAARDWALQGYKIESVYNVPINQALGNLPNNFTNHEYYRQGHFYNGHWYISQLSDNLSKKDQGISGGAINQSGIEGSTGGVVAIKATEEIDVRAGFVGKVVEGEEFASTGLAVDDNGTIFMRHNNLDKLKKTVPSGTTWYSDMYDAYDRRITEGALYARNTDGTYASEPTIIDLSALWNDIDNLYFTGATSYGQVKGRSDYYNMYGDVMSAEGGYLIISPSWTHTMFKVKIANGAYVNHEIHNIEEYQSADGMVKVKTGTENYGFKIDGRNAWMAQIRSNGYFGIHGEEENHEGEHEHDMHAIYVADSRINNTGGTSIVAFDNPNTTDVNEGEIFLITPASMHSRNQGDFIVTRGVRENAADDVAKAKLTPPMAIAQFEQTELNTNVATNANGNWFHAEVGTYESATGETSECIYVYQYVPGIRFAKYRIYPDNQYPAIFPTLAITTAYNEDKTEITHFEGVATWKRPQGFGTKAEVASNANVKVKSYNFELYNAAGELIYSDEVMDEDYAAGTTPTEESDNVVYKFDYFTDMDIASVNECDLDFQTYTARVAVNYVFTNGKDPHQSEFGSARANNTYVSDVASDRHIWMYKKANVTEQVWERDEVNDTWVTVDRAFDNYRVEIDFSKPTGTDEPVSYYTIHAYVNNQTDLIDITDFHLHKGVETVNGVNQAVLDRDEKGNVIPTSQVPGTYIFEGDNENPSWKAPYYSTGKWSGGESRQNSVLTWHHKVPAGYYTSGVATVAEGDEIIITDEPDDWKFVVVAHYAANNRSINKNEEAQFNPETGFIETGVEVIGEDASSSLQIYPIPASTEITIKSPEAINSIVVYNEAGVEVMSLVGNGEATTTVNIEDLATGYYFVKVNNQAPVKIIKK